MIKMRPDRLSELFRGTTLKEIIENVGNNESITIKIAQQTGIKVTRQKNITFGQALLAASWFPILAAVIGVAIWKVDSSSVTIHYAKDHLAITVTGLFGAWVLATVLTVYCFRYIRGS